MCWGAVPGDGMPPDAHVDGRPCGFVVDFDSDLPEGCFLGLVSIDGLPGGSAEAVPNTDLAVSRQVLFHGIQVLPRSAIDPNGGFGFLPGQRDLQGQYGDEHQGEGRGFGFHVCPGLSPGSSFCLLPRILQIAQVLATIGFAKNVPHRPPERPADDQNGFIPGLIIC